MPSKLMTRVRFPSPAPIKSRVSAIGESQILGWDSPGTPNRCRHRGSQKWPLVRVTVRPGKSPARRANGGNDEFTRGLAAMTIPPEFEGVPISRLIDARHELTALIKQNLYDKGS
jgi:hypothetical protein